MHWFVRKGLFFKPISTFGWGLFILTAGYAVFAFVEVNEHAHSTVEMLINASFRVLLAGLTYTIVAYFMSEKE